MMRLLRRAFRPRTSLLWLVLGGGMLWAGAALGQVLPQSRIRGVVVNDRDGSPLARCRMTATPSGVVRGENPRPVETQSDEHGRFALELPAGGNWRLTATRRGFHLQAYEHHGNFFTGIVLTSARPAFEGVFRATPDAVVGGRVIDEAGEPVRNAPVSLTGVDGAAAPQGVRAQQTTTDTAGRYEFSGLEPGAYLVNVRARPWYAPQGVFAGPNGATGPGGTGPDPSLDVVYPVTWYPGTADEELATPLTVLEGERAEADFHLLPMPAAHLLLPAPARQESTPPSQGIRGGFPRGNAQVSLLLPHGGLQPVTGPVSMAANGEIDMGGLAPGTYQVTLPGTAANEPGRTTVLRIGAGGSVTEVGAGVTGSTLTLAVDGDTGVNATQIVLVDTVTGRTISPGGRRREGFGPGAPGQMRRTRGGAAGIGASAGPVDIAGTPGRTAGSQGVPGGTWIGAGPAGAETQSPVSVQLPPGRYEVTVQGNSGAFLTGLTATGAQAEGRFVTVREGSASLTVHLASGLGSVEGDASGAWSGSDGGRRWLPEGEPWGNLFFRPRRAGTFRGSAGPAR